MDKEHLGGPLLEYTPILYENNFYRINSYSSSLATNLSLESRRMQPAGGETS